MIRVICTLLNFLIFLNSAVTENNNDNSSMVEINFSISLNFRFSDRGGISLPMSVRMYTRLS